MTFRQHQKFLSAYKKYYKIIKNRQLTNRSFYKQGFIMQAQAPTFLISKNTTALFVTNIFLTNNVCNQKWNYKSNIIQNFIGLTNETQIKILIKRQRVISNALKGILLVNFPEKEKNFLIKNLAAENKIALITQSASLLLKDSQNMDDLLGVDDPIQILFDRVKTCLPCICFINNLDRIGKQRYEEEHQSLYGFNTSISSSIESNFIHDRVSETINQKEKFNLPTINEWSQFNNQRDPARAEKKSSASTGRIFKNLQTRPRFLKPFSASAFLAHLQTHPNKVAPTDAKDYEFWLTKKLRSEFLFRSFLLQKNTVKKQDYLKFLNPFQKNFKTFVNTRTTFNQKAFPFPIFHFWKGETQPKRLLNNGYYHRLPFWLLARREMHKNPYFPKYKIGISRVKLFDFFYHYFFFGSSILLSLPLPINPWLLQRIFSQTRSNQSGSMFTKTKYNMVNFKTRTWLGGLKNPSKSSSGPLFKDSLIKLPEFVRAHNTEILKNQLKPTGGRGLVSKINNYSFASSKRRLYLKNLGNPMMDGPSRMTELSAMGWLTSFPEQPKIPAARPWEMKRLVRPNYTKLGGEKTSLSSSKQSTFGASLFEQAFFFGEYKKIPRSRGDRLLKRRTRTVYQLNEIKNAKNCFGNVSFSFDMKKKRLASLLSQNFATGSLPPVGFKDKFFNTKLKSTRLTNSDLLSDVERESTKRNSLKITETEIIKNTALLKFLQILDGFHTTTEKKKWVSFPYLSIFISGETLKTPTKKNTFQPRLTWEMVKTTILQAGKYRSDSRGRVFYPLWLQRCLKNSFKQPSTHMAQIKPPCFYTDAFPHQRSMGGERSLKHESFKTDRREGTGLIRLREHRNEWSKWVKRFFMPKTSGSMGLSPMLYAAPYEAEVIKGHQEKIKLKPPPKAKLKTDRREGTGDKSFVSAHTKPQTNNFLTFQPRNYSDHGIRNSMQNKWFSKIRILARTEPRQKTTTQPFRYATFQNSIYGTNMIDKPNKSFLGDVFTKKIFQSFSFVRKVPKWELYLKNQPVLKSLNLLCVWPSSSDDRVSPFSLNDGACYILPEYFQLLGHGSKLKKQGITLIASTNNLTTLDAALLRPGRFDTIINFSHVFSSITKGGDFRKHLPSLTQKRVLSISKSSSRKREIASFYNPPFTFFKKSAATHAPIIKEKEKNFLVLLEKNTDFLFNNTILTLSFPVINMYKTVKNQFDPQVTVLDIPNRSIPIKTFIDVSIFIQYKLWWSFKKGKLSWFELYGSRLIQKPKIPVSDSEKFKMFKPTGGRGLVFQDGVNIQIIFQLKTYINLIRAFIMIFRVIGFKVYTTFQVKFWRSSVRANFKTIRKGLETNQTEFFGEALTNQNFDFINRLGWESLVAKAVIDFDFSLPFENHFRDTFSYLPDDRNQDSASIWPVKNSAALHAPENHNASAALHTRQNTNHDTQEFPKNYYSLYNFLKKYYEPNKQIGKLWNNKNQTVQRFKSTSLEPRFFDMKHDQMFLKFNRNLLFCIGDFDYKTYPLRDPSLREKDFDFISAPVEERQKTKSKLAKKEKHHFFLVNQQNQTKNISQSQASDPIKNKTIPNLYFNQKKEKNVFLESEFGYETQIDLATAFLDPSLKICAVSHAPKENSKAHVIKNVHKNHVLLTKYNEIYKLKKIKVKKQSFFNLHPFTQFMLKRWPKVTKPNKLKRHLKISLASIFYRLEKGDVSLFFNYENGYTDICLPWKNQINSCFKTDKGLSKNHQFFKTYRNHDLKYKKQKSKSSKKNDDPVKTNFKKPFNDSFFIQDPQNFSAAPPAPINDWFDNFNLGSLYTQIYSNLYKATLLMPNLKKESLKTSETNNFFSTDRREGTGESYLLKKLTCNSSLNIMCLQVNPTFHPLTEYGCQPISSSISSTLPQKKRRWEEQTKSNSGLENQTKKNIIDKSFSYNSLTWKSWISSIDLLQTENRLKKIARRTVINNINHDFQTGFTRLRTHPFQYFHAKTNQQEMNNNIILLKNLVFNEKKQHNLIEKQKSSFQSSKIHYTEPVVEINQWSGTHLDTSFFLLIFYTMFFEKIKHQKILNTITISMPYRSLIFSHFLLSQGQTYGFSYKNFEILVYNKFKNFFPPTPFFAHPSTPYFP